MKPKVVVFTDYLGQSMTFIYRQLLGVQDEFDPVVLAPTLTNLDVFPFEPIYHTPRPKTFWFRSIRAIQYVLGNKTIYTSRRQQNAWYEILKKEQPAMIHAHFGPGGLQILPAAKRLKIPLLVSFHGYDVSTLPRKKTYRKELQELFSYSHNIAVSKVMKKQLLTLGANVEKTFTHYIGIPLDKFTYQKRQPIHEKIYRTETIKFLQVSNFVEKKGHEYTIEAFLRILQHYPDCELRLAGDGDLRPRIESIVNQKELQDKVIFLGKVTPGQVPSLMHAADIFLHHSVTATDSSQEGIPTVLMEAMGTGLPVFSTYHAGIPELIEDGKTGYLSPEKDIQEYSQKILSLFKTQNHPGKAASDYVHKYFNTRIQNQKLKQIYREMI